MAAIYLLLGSVFGGMGVALGAFGAHGLRSRVSLERLQTFETAARYQIYHSLTLLVTAVLLHQGLESIWLVSAGWLFTAGVLFFSGSLYALVITGQRRWGAIAPIGGAAWIIGWVCLGISAILMLN